MFSTAEVEARAPLINHLKDYFPGIDENTPTRELIHKARLTGASDPWLARAIRRCEDVEQNSRTEQSALNNERNEAWFIQHFNAHLVAHMDGDNGLIGSSWRKMRTSAPEGAFEGSN